MTLTFDIHIGSCTHLPILISKTTIVSETSIILPFFPYKSIRDQIWPWRKIGQGQHKVIILTNLVVLEYSMLHTKFQGHRPFGSREDFFKVFTIYEHGSHIGHVTWTSWTNFRSFVPWRLHMKFGFTLLPILQSKFGSAKSDLVAHFQRMKPRTTTTGHINMKFTQEPGWLCLASITLKCSPSTTFLIYVQY